MNNQFVGHSGCKLELIGSSDNFIVRKTSHALNYNTRLKNQFIKQSTVSLGAFSQTKVFNSGNDSDGLFFFDMEFIPGRNLAKVFNELNEDEIDFLSEVFSDLYKTEACYHSSEIYLEKISLLISSLKQEHQLALEKPIARLMGYRWKIEKSSVCHGDLGLENILLFNNELYIIDLLDSFSNSWVMDIAKVLQDVETHWAFRDQSMNPKLESMLVNFKSLLFRKLIAKGLTFKQYSDCYYVLLLNLVRILPYSKNKITDQFLIDAIQQVSLKIDSTEIDYEYINRTLRG